MTRYMCTKCFLLKESEEAPDSCPMCGAGQSEFTVVKYTQAGYIPDYWKAHLEEKIARVHSNQVKAGRKGTSFALISDIHWGPNCKYSAALLEMVMNRCAIPYYINAGDTVSGSGLCPKDIIIKELTECQAAFSNLESRCLTALGNHDSAYSTLGAPYFYAEDLTKEEVYEYMFRYEAKYPDRVMSDDGTYFYADDKTHKMRYIILNTYDVPSDERDELNRARFSKMWQPGIRQEQLQWFADVALAVPSPDWSVVLCTHTNPNSGENIFNAQVVLDIVDAYRRGIPFEAETVCELPEYNVSVKGDFSGRPGNFVAWVSGHMHLDIFNVYKDTVCISITSDWNYPYDKSGLDRSSGTTGEHAFDVYTVDPVRHKVYVTRFGSGEDKEFDYSALY